MEPTNQPHGNHAGDFPVLFSNKGYARMCFFTDKFKVQDIIGKSIIIHENPDDYRTQPAAAGSAGMRNNKNALEKQRAKALYFINIHMLIPILP